ncbi:MAG TPA: hypothetical protein VL048_02115, partial [Xanthobacteraceae bacterium]|nr:hypothetical protein [Xanthobacteraceae bacterium]
ARQQVLDPTPLFVRQFISLGHRCRSESINPERNESAPLRILNVDWTYKTEEAYVFALAEVMKREYEAIVDSGFILQLDCPDLAMLRHTVYADTSLADFRNIIAVNVAALNHAVAGIPAERMRLHVCWGSTVAPHHTDVPLIDIIDIVLTAKPNAVSFPAANGRHEHEWKIWRQVKLPAGKVIIPGVIDSTVNTVEHPEVVADRILNFANGVGRENVIAGVDCGFGTFAGRVQVDSKIVWLKLQSLAAGARQASAQLWPQAASALREKPGRNSFSASRITD